MEGSEKKQKIRIGGSQFINDEHLNMYNVRCVLLSVK